MLFGFFFSFPFILCLFLSICLSLNLFTFFLEAGIAQLVELLDYGLDDGGIVVRFLPKDRPRCFYSPVCRPVLNPRGLPSNGLIISPMVKLPRRQVRISPVTSAEVKSVWTFTSIPPYVFLA
jgi:hypothetical protein